MVGSEYELVLGAVVNVDRACGHASALGDRGHICPSYTSFGDQLKQCSANQSGAIDTSGAWAHPLRACCARASMSKPTLVSRSEIAQRLRSAPFFLAFSLIGLRTGGPKLTQRGV
ncbi:hypothetical protein BH18ACT16_BH18ACT16_15700 [soil metagenome]